MPKPTNNSFQKLEVNFVSMSDITFFGTPCNMTPSRMNNYATLLAENVDFIGMKCATFVNLTTITMMESCCLTLLKKPVIMYMEMTSHFNSRIKIICRSPTGCLHFALCLHLLTIKTPSQKLCCILFQI